MAIPVAIAAIGRAAVAVGGTVARNPGAASAGAGAAGDLKKTANQLGQLQDRIVITIKGGPQSDMKQLFRLAAAVAFGKINRLVAAGGRFNPLPPPGAMGVKYSLTRKELAFELRLNRGLLTATSTLFGAGAAAVSRQPVISGPESTTIGGEWDFRFTAAPPLLLGGAIPVGSGPIVYPTLEFAGKTILTAASTSPDPNPAIGGAGEIGPTKHLRPQGDARSRGTLARMVIAALSSQAETGPSTFVLPTDANRFTGG